MFERFRGTSVLGFAAALVLASGVALAQPGASLPAEVIQTLSEVAPAQQSQIDEFVARHADRLASADPEERKRARVALLEPLANARVSAPFRIAYGRALEPRLDRLAGSQDPLVALNALIVSGELATARSLDLLRARLRDAKPDVRLQSAVGLGRAFTQVREKAPAVNSDQVAQAIAAVAAAMREEADGLVLDAMVRAMLAGAGLESTRARAVESLTQAMGDRATRDGAAVLSEAALAAHLRALRGVRQILAAPSGSGAGALPASAIRGSAELAGHVIAHGVRVAEARALPDGASPARDAYAQLCQEGETVVLLASDLLGQRGGTPKNLGELLRSGTKQGDAQFSVDARTIVGREGLLARRPFEFPADRFLR